MPNKANAERLKAAIMWVPLVGNSMAGCEPGFNMSCTETWCGTPRCIAGHAAALMGRRLEDSNDCDAVLSEFLEIELKPAYNLAFSQLKFKGCLMNETREEACRAIDNAIAGKLYPWEGVRGV